jgi:hypothetical protein
MSRSTFRIYELSEDWAVTRGKSNWILLDRSGSKPKQDSSYPNVRLLISGLYKKVSLITPEKPALLSKLKAMHKALDLCFEHDATDTEPELSEQFELNLGEDK